MDSAFSPLGFLIFGISISLYAIIAQSQTQNGNNGAEFAPPTFWVSGPPPPPPPPPPSPPPPPPSRVKPPPPPSQHEEISASPLGSPRLRGRHRHRHRKPPPLPPPPPPPSNQMNAGKKVGLLFVGIAAIMQVGMVGFLVFKRRQLLRSDDRYESCS